MEQKTDLIVTSSPQINKQESTAKIMWTVSACLIPAGVWGVFVFGPRALLVVAVSILSALIGEYVIGRFFKRFTLWDGSAFLTGLLIGYNMPPSVPLYIPIIASLFAVLVVKWSFGGLGANWMNPALAGRVFVFFSWTGAMTRWSMPKTLPSVDAVSGASPLGFLKAGLLDYTGGLSGPVEFLNANGYPHSVFDGRAIEWLNRVFGGGGIDNGYMDFFVGNVPGSIGEVSALFLLIGAIYLFATRIITWRIPVSYLASFGILTWIFGGMRFGAGPFHGDVLFHFFTGGLILGAFYMATDMVTSPVSKKGMLIFGVGCGFFTFLIRFYGSFPEGVSLAIIIMNIFVPMINRFTGPKRFGLPGKERQ